MVQLFPQLVFAGTIFSSAFCLFLIQPIIAKQILPWFGGSAAVWAICMVFFQLILLAGYAYSDWTSRKLRPKGQVALHVALLLLSLMLLPIIAGNQWKPTGDEEPTWLIISLLMATVGLPYFVLSTTGPLIQSWVARSFASSQVYRYFSLSNLASLIALVSYPFLIERHSAIVGQAYGWSVGYAVFALMCAGAAVLFLRHGHLVTYPTKNTSGHVDEQPAPTARKYAFWLVTSAMGSWMLLAVTSHITQNVAAIPFLWLMPLTLYLLTFVLCFESDRWYRPAWFRPVAAILMLVCAYGLQDEDVGREVVVAVPLYIAGLFAMCMFFHGELALQRPGPRHLTRFYLMVSLGGAAGGITVGLLAPRILPAYYELGIGFLVTSALGFIVVKTRAHRMAAIVTGLLCAIFFAFQVQDDLAGSRYIGRNFYGTLLTVDSSRGDPSMDRRQLYHGSVKHGEQFLDARLRRQPTAYYGETSGIGLAIALTPSAKKRVGVIGLGAGTLATYGRAGDTYRMYELNPAVVEVAKSEFTFLADSAAHIDMVLGDARLSMEREPDQEYDVLAVDAFSGDAIPVHLITMQAMDVYLRHVKPSGVIAFHLTNRFLNLAPVVAEIAKAKGLHTALVHDESDKPAQRTTDWMLVSRTREVLNQAPIQRSTIEPTAISGLGLWTDDFNNLFDVLR